LPDRQPGAKNVTFPTPDPGSGMAQPVLIGRQPGSLSLDG
jgi:hypothetical protein